MRIVLAIILAGFVATTAHGSEPTEAEKAACEPDARSLCAAAILNVFSKKTVHERVFDCLKLNKAQLSSPCRAAFRAHGA